MTSWTDANPPTERARTPASMASRDVTAVDRRRRADWGHPTIGAPKAFGQLSSGLTTVERGRRAGRGDPPRNRRPQSVGQLSSG
ncbi:hypothetical protein Afe04nite_66530 [Asanoa ferruginea]|nr:hypothetical protein Afe04nite_66530 [Asanoa ferruginea]